MRGELRQLEEGRAGIEQGAHALARQELAAGGMLLLRLRTSAFGHRRDLRAEIVASPSQQALGRLSRIDEDTLVIGLSAGRPHPLITRTIKLARHRKATTLAITDATLSEVARLAQIRLYYSSNSPAFVRSHAALLSLIQALAYGVYSRDAQQYDVRIKAFRLK